MNPHARQPLIDLIAQLPRWQDAQSRQALFDDLIWWQCDTNPAMAEDGPAAAAQVVDLAFAVHRHAETGDATQWHRGVCALIEDLRELGAASPAILNDLAQQSGCNDPEATWTADPYPGLLPFAPSQMPVFFGRRAETRDLLRRLADPHLPRLQLVCGVLGCGKTSLVRAGVAASLGRGGLPRLVASEHWLISSLYPAGHEGDPFLALTHGLAHSLGAGVIDPSSEAASLKGYGAEAMASLVERVLAGRPAGACWLVAIDQFEELFTTVDVDLAEEFIDTLVASLHLPGLRILANLRADLLHRCFLHEGLTRILNAGGLYCVGPPSQAGMERMIQGPLTRLVESEPVAVEPALVTQILRDMRTHPGVLAALADVLRELFERVRPTGLMTLADYQAEYQDGLGAVLTRRTERALERAGDNARAALHRLFSGLVAVDGDGTAVCRRAPRATLATEPCMASLIDALSASDIGLLRIEDGQRPAVAFAHEALLQEWPAVRRWVDRRREALRIRTQIEAEAHEWASAGYPPEGRWRHEVLDDVRDLLAETGLLEDLERVQILADFLTPMPDWLIAELLCSRVEAVEREEIGLHLAQIGDPRPGVGLVDGLPDIAWCDIPAGEVRIEGHGLLQVSPFRLAAYPVTQGQFECFLNARDGFARPNWWTGLRQAPPVSGRIRRHGNYPATHLSWFDATAFCRWLSERLGYPVRLPDEWEWQLAAQSARPGFIYPWGRDWRTGHANTDESGVGRATAVGMYPAGRSAQGAYDLAGNTWEWCRNRYDDPKLTAANTDSARVLRGGSWRVNMGFSRSDFRLDGLPEERMGGSSFRLVCAG